MKLDFQICQYLNAGNWTRVWDDTKAATYAINGDQWVGYDDLDSLAAKVWIWLGSILNVPFSGSARINPTLPGQLWTTMSVN